MMTPTSHAAEVKPAPFVPPITPEELTRRNQAVMALLDEWAEDIESDHDQRETMEFLRAALGPERIASDRASIR